MNLYKHDLDVHPDTTDVVLDEVYYIIIETQEGALTTACVQDFDMYDYNNVVSRYGFNNEHEAVKYGRSLAKKNELRWEGGMGLLD